MKLNTKGKLTKRHAYIIAIVVATLVMVLDSGFCIGNGVFSDGGHRERPDAAAFDSGMAPPDAEGDSASGMQNPSENASSSNGVESGSSDANSADTVGSSGKYANGDESASSGKDRSDVQQRSSSSESAKPSMSRGSSSGRPEQSRGTGVLAYGAIALFAICLIVDIVCVIGLIRLRKRGQEGEMPQDGSAHATEEPVDPVQMRQRKQHRQRIAGAIALAIVVAIVIVLQLLGNAGRPSGATVDERVVSGTAETGSISKSLLATGVISSAADENVSIPGNITVSEYHVSPGDAVKKGDIIATVDRTGVLAGIADIQNLIDELDAEVAELQESSASTAISATANGTVIKLYADAGESVTDVMYDHGALAVLSLDNLLAIDVSNNGSLHVGDTVTVVGDSATVDGTVADIEKETVTVTVAIGTLAFGDEVSVYDATGAKLGTGRLVGHNQQNVTGYSGTVAYTSVSEGNAVSAGDTLLTLTDVDNSAEYQTLLRRRKILVNQSNALQAISKTGYVCATEDGVISDLNEDILVSDTATSSSTQSSVSNSTGTANTTTASLGTTRAETRRLPMAMPNAINHAAVVSANTRMAAMHLASKESTPTASAQSKTTVQADDTASDALAQSSEAAEPKQERVTKTVNVVWTGSDGTALSEGLPGSVAVILAANGSTVDTATLSEGNDWSTSFEVDKYDENGDEISYAISLDGSVDGFSSSWSTSGSKTNIIMKKDAESTSDDEEEDTNAASGASSSSAASSSSTSSGASSSGAASSGALSSGAASSSSSGSSAKQSGSAAASGKSAAATDGTSSGASNKPGVAGTSAQSGGAASSGASSGGNSEQITTEGATLEDATDKENAYEYAETVLGTLTPNDTVSVDVAIDELDVSSIAVGSKVSVTLDALTGQSFDGAVSALDPNGVNSGGNTKYTVTISMDKQENMFLGMTASARVGLETRDGVVTVPESAIVEQDGKTYLYTSYDEASGELGDLVEISTGIADGERAEVTSGLESGQAYYYRFADTISYTFANR